MLETTRDQRLRVRGPLFILCMVPFLCSTKETTSVTKQSERYLNNRDYVTFENAPEGLANANISVEYLCSRPCTVHMDVVASSEFRTGILVFKKSWKNEKHVHELRSRSVNLMLPSRMVYRSDDIMKHSIEVYFVALRAWVVHNDHVESDSKHNETIFYAAAKAYKVVDTRPPHQRPYKDHQICKSWYLEHRWRKKETSISVCPLETDVFTLISSPLASSHEYSGLIKKFESFNNIDLEMRRRQLVKHYPMFTFSIWMYLLDYCKSKECGIIHHVDSSKMYTTPLLFLTPTGQVHVQMQLRKGSDIAILSHFSLPLYQWVRLDVMVHGGMIVLHTFVGREVESYESQTYSVDDEINFDDTDGFMALGGSKYVAGIDGFFGPVKYYRLKALQMDEISNPLPEDELYRQIQDYYSRCFTVKDIVHLYVDTLKEKHIKETKSQAKNPYMDLYLKYRDRPICKIVSWTQEDERKHSHLFQLLTSTERISMDFWNDPVPAVGKKMFESVIRDLSNGFQHLNSSIPHLMDASCCGYHKASYLLAIIYEIGLGVPTNPTQALLYSLIGAQEDDRLALLKLGYKHLQGIDTHSLDLDVAFVYYMNIAKKTPKDRLARHAEQAFVETVRLMDDDILKEQTRETDDLFLWLKQNAERGDPYAQHRLAQMLFWGQQGVTQDTRAAIEWYERGAMENEEPVLMYDYAVLLFKGDGVPKNKKLALELMKKSASKGQVEALNGLGWYYHNFKKDYVRAVKYWSRAYDKGNADAAFNLGVMHLQGIYPAESGANETRAFEYMSKASEGGHIEASINVAQYLITGSLRNIQRNPEAAIILAKFVAEQNGNIGLIIRKAVNAYLDGSLNEAFLHFILAAEAGIESSQTNVAYLCEELPELSAILRDTCILRYYNLSAHQPTPSTYALLKMGDMYYYGGESHHRDLEESGKMYTQAAALGDAQGFFNLAQLIQEGITVHEYMLRHLKLSTSVFGDKHTLVIELYERCQNHSSDEGISPCTLVLLYLQVNDVWNSLLHSPMVRVGGHLYNITS
ncbi:PREDICTED: protein sel-1 homolog 3 [Nanorana parkeri]|uniref:protein sel-1 homolog 3 n=1 Tax=Nanorana parkeri TaxID=125878 RepID=UPI0008548DD9|nr:PREDICTED: protein sel-1 homolog 3 [Nanorana parkeri]